MAIEVSIQLIDTEVVHKSNKYFHEVKRALQSVKKQETFGERKQVRFPDTLNERERTRFKRFAKGVSFCFWKFVAILMDEFIELVKSMHQTELFSGKAGEPTIKLRGGGLIVIRFLRR